MVVLLLAAGLAVQFAAAQRPPTAHQRRLAGRAAIVVLALVPVFAVIALAAAPGGVDGQVSKAWNQLTDPNARTPANTPDRLTATSSVRARYWSEALDIHATEPWLGTGAGAYATVRTRFRDDTLAVRHAHGYVVQTLADLGWAGLAVSLIAAAAWLLAAAARHRPARAATAACRTTPSGSACSRSRSSSSSSACTRPSTGPGSSPPTPASRCCAPAGSRAAGRCAPGSRRPTGRPAPPARRGRTPAGSRGWASACRRCAALAVIVVIATALAAAWTAYQPVRAVHAGDAAFDRLDRGQPDAAANIARIATDRNPLSADPLFELSAIEQARGAPTRPRRRSSEPSSSSRPTPRRGAGSAACGCRCSTTRRARWTPSRPPTTSIRKSPESTSDVVEASARGPVAYGRRAHAVSPVRSSGGPPQARTRTASNPDRSSVAASEPARVEAQVLAERVEVRVEARERDQRGLDAAVEGHGDQQAPAGPQHATHLEQQVLGVGDVLEHLRAPHEVDARRGRAAASRRARPAAGPLPGRCAAPAGAPPRRARRRPGRRRRRAAPRRTGRRRSRGRARARRAAPRRAAASGAAPTPTARDPAVRRPRNPRTGGARARGYAVGGMRLRLIRNATLHVRLAGRCVLVDPMLDPAGARPPVEDTADPRRNPLVELPEPAEVAVKGLHAAIVTHLHRDHLDDAAIELLPPDLPLFAQPEDEERAPRARVHRRAAGVGRGGLERRADRAHRRPPRDRPDRRADGAGVGLRARGRGRAGALHRRRHDLVRGGRRRAGRAPSRRGRRERGRRPVPRGRPDRDDRRRRGGGRPPRTGCARGRRAPGGDEPLPETRADLRRGSTTTAFWTASRCRTTAPKCGRRRRQYLTATMLARPTGKRKGRSCMAVRRRGFGRAVGCWR